MAELKLTATQGLKAEDEDAWDGFYDAEEEARRRAAEEEKKRTQMEKDAINTPKGFKAEDHSGVNPVDEVDAWEGYYDEKEEEARRQAEEEEKARTKTENETYNDDFDTEGEEEKGIRNKDNTAEKHAATENKKGNATHSSKKSKKKGKTKPKPHSQSHSRSDNSKKSSSGYSRERNPASNATNDKENSRHTGRKLQRRQQVRHVISLGPAAERSGRDPLEQKFEELEDLMTRPLVDTRGRIPREQVERMVNLHHRYGEAGHDDGESGDIRTGQQGEHQQGYSTIRVLQATGPSRQLHITCPDQCSSAPPRHSPRPPSSRPRRGSVDTPPTSSSGRSQSSQKDGDWLKESGYAGYSSDEDGGSDEESRKPYQPTDMHLKHTDNPKLREWLKRKDAEHRRARKAERAKRREERNDKMVEGELKIARREKSSERIKQWMTMKRKEALLRQKEERRRNKLEEGNRRASSSPDSGVRGTRIDRPRTAPVSKSPYRLIKRPNSAARLDEGDGSTAKPPDSKFVYKRSVTGRVRLMKLQNERNAELRSADQQRFQELSSKEGEKKTRSSYDQWLIAKKKQEVEKRKAAKRQQELAKSDPELENIIPQMARQRIDRVKNGRRSLDTGLGPRSTNSGGEEQGEQSGEENGGQNRPSYNLAVSGVAATVVEAPTPVRPASAKSRPPSARKAASPQRPRSANPTRAPAAKAKTGDSTEQGRSPSPYTLPFPDDLGVPDHVRRVQERIFSKDLTSQSDDGERPEPQGCDTAESAACPEVVDEPLDSSATLLQGFQLAAAALQSTETEEQATLVAVENALLNVASPPVESSPGEDQASQNTDLEKDDGESEKSAEETQAEADGEEDEDEYEDEEDEDEDAHVGVEDEEAPEPCQETEAGETTQHTEEDAQDNLDEDEGKEATIEDDGGEDEELQQDEDEENVAEGDGQEGEEEEGGGDATETGEQHQEEQQITEDKNKTGEEEEEEEEAAEDVSGQGEATVEETEGETQQEMAEPEPVSGEEQAVETAIEEAENPTEEQTDTLDNQQTDTQVGTDNEAQESDSNPTKSDKHVSFSEELATVFEPVSTETSSNFDDERGDDEQEDTQFMSLDDTPDPEW